MVNGLSMAEHCVDRKVKTELFRCRQIELVAGQVLLHALDERGQPLCGQAISAITWARDGGRHRGRAQTTRREDRSNDRSDRNRRGSASVHDQSRRL